MGNGSSGMRTGRWGSERAVFSCQFSVRSAEGGRARWARFHEVAGVVGEQAGFGTACAGDADNERRRITALRLARYFKTNAEFLAELAEFLRFGVPAARREDLGDRAAGAAGGGGVVSLQLLKKGNLAEKCS